MPEQRPLTDDNLLHTVVGLLYACTLLHAYCTVGSPYIGQLALAIDSCQVINVTVLLYNMKSRGDRALRSLTESRQLTRMPRWLTTERYFYQNTVVRT